MKLTSRTIRFHAVAWQLLILVLLLDSCSARRIQMPGSKSIEAFMKDQHVPTVGVCIIQKAEIQQVKLFGNIEYHSPAPRNTLFNLASLTKPLISTTTLKLVSNGQWDLDEPLCHYWTDPDVIDDSFNTKLTTRHVLSHQSGLPNWRGHEPGGKLTFAFEPGSQWKYSGEGFEYLRKAIENKFHISIEKLVDSILFNPIEMTDTRFYWDGNMDTTLYAERYNSNGVQYEKEKWYSANASNLVMSTMEDYGKFAVAILKQNFLSLSMQNEMIKPQAKVNNDKEFGLGWNLVRNLTNGHYALTHTGRNRGQNTVIILLPEDKRGIIVFTNGDNGDKVYEKIIADYFDLGKEILSRMK
ncbi:MAG TPA: serine hydrolase domain-containing protein [Flavitalea sp.]|nr:serine hydrolase domain-containing protein [Flavitalea sp.]